MQDASINVINNALTFYTNMSLEEMQQHTTLLINVFDKDHRIMFWNKRCEEYFQIPEEAAIGQILEELLPQVKKDERLSLLKRALEGQAIHVLNEKYKNRTGRYEQRVLPVKDADGNIIAALNIVEDLP